MSKKSAVAPEPLIGGMPWSAIWPGVEKHLNSVLRSRLPFGSDRSDVVQETAVALFKSRKPMKGSRDVIKVATRIAVNMSIDQGRRSQVVSWCPLTQDVADHQDVEREVLSRFDAAALKKEAARTAIDLSAFELEPVAGTPDSSAIRSSRYRARQKLKRWREGLGGALAFPKLRWLLGSVAATATLVPSAVPFVGHHFAPPPATAAPSRLTDTGTWASATTGAPLPAEPGIAPSASGASIGPIEASPAGPTYRPQLKISGPAGTGAEKGTKEYPPEDPPDHVICLTGLTPLPDVCPPIQP